jgi:hypothetical protein
LKIDDGDFRPALTIAGARAKQDERDDAGQVQTLAIHGKTSDGR